MARASARGSEFYTVDSGEVKIHWDGPIATVFLNGVESSAIHTQRVPVLSITLLLWRSKLNLVSMMISLSIILMRRVAYQGNYR